MPLKTTKKTRRNARAPVSRYISRAEQTSLAYVAYLDLIEVAEYLRGEMAQQLANFDLTTAEYGLLEAVFRDGPQFQEPLREKLRCSKQHVSRVVERLERAGYVRRRASSLKPAPEQRWVNPKEAASVDRPRRGHRIRMVKLTPAGEETMKRIFPKRTKVVKALMRVLDGREQRSLSRLCRKLREGHIMKYIRELEVVEDWEDWEGARGGDRDIAFELVQE